MNSTAPRPSHAEWGAARGMLSAEGAQAQLYHLRDISIQTEILN
eukprot:COSAG01_NODE_7433_length_3213_cov_1.156390_1_plen_44_part_00